MNPYKNEKMREKILQSKKTSKEAWDDLQQNLHDPDLWYVYAMALGNEGHHEESVDAFSQALAENPFNSDLYFGRGRKNNHCGRFHSAIADLTMAIRLEPEVWAHWYYRATTYNLNGMFKEAGEDFEHCISVAEEYERCPMVHWLYTTYIELGDMDAARKCLARISADIVPPQMDYGYHRCILLYKGILTPDTFVDIPDMEKKCLKQPGRINLELNTMYYGLYCFHLLNGENDKADSALRKLIEIAVPNAFGWLRGKVAAEKRGLIKN
jgi:tetratricopeptide (TPR) repeat protein